MATDDYSSPEIVQVLVENHRAFLSFLHRHVASPSDAEDILQAAYIKGIQKSSSLRKRESATQWFYRLLRNALIDYYRHQDAKCRAVEDWATNLAQDYQPDLDRAVCRCVHDLLPTLKGEYSELIQRIDLDGEQISQLASEKGKTPNNLRVTLHRARLALGKQLQRSCGSCADHGCLECDCKSSH